MSGVRNLRAMFENKDTSTSPPDRGRSPAESIGTGSNGTSPRPLSKVRTSFVAVERSGQLGSQLGLKRENSGEPSMARRRESFSIDEEEHPQATAERKLSIATELDARKKSTVIEETIPEVAVETPMIELDKQLEGPSKGATKPATETVDPKKLPPSNTTSNGHQSGSKNPVTTAKTVDKPSSTKFAARPAPILTKSSVAPKPSHKTIKSPAPPKTPTTPRGRESNQLAGKKAEKKEIKHVATSTNSSKPAGRPTTSTAQASISKSRIPASPPQATFVKPKPRSPTRPIKLPASLTAHTASSGSKTSVTLPQTAGRQSLSRASGHSQTTNTLQSHPVLSRSPSRTNTATAPKTLARKPSTLNKTHNRPSLGPPPSQLKKQPSRNSLPSNAPADEGFLARMMRPTTSSASKTTEKVTTPPKRAPSTNRPVSRDGPPRHEAPKMGKLVTKPAIKDIKASSSSAPQKAKEVEATPVAEEKPEASAVPETPQPHRELADVTGNTSQITEPVEPAAEDVKVMGENEGISEEKEPAEEPTEELALPAVLERTTEVESTPEKPIPIEQLIPTPESPTKDQFPTLNEPVVVPEAEEEVPQKTEDVKAVTKAIERSECEPVPEKAVEVEIPKEVEAMEDPEDVKAREEIAKLNAEVMKASLDDQDVE